MFEINLPAYDVNVRVSNGQRQIFDVLRKKFVALTPEEWVRQHFVHFLIAHKGYPKSLIGNEMSIELNEMSRRCDSVVMSRSMTPLMIVEYKAPSVRITREVFDQILAYNHVLRVKYLVVSNGMEHYCCRLDVAAQQWIFLPEIPTYEQL